MGTAIKPRQKRLLEALVQDTNILTACAAAGVSRMTAYRWMEAPAFKDELEGRRNAVLTGALENVKAKSVRAAEELTGLLGTKDERLRRLVCNDVLTHAMKIRELEDFERRLTALENAQAKVPKKGGQP